MAAHPPVGWPLDPVLLGVLASSGVLYAAGTRRLWTGGRRGRGVRVRQVWAFAGGLGALCAALVSPLDGVADQLLSVHMVQHVLLVLMAAPLLVIGRPGLVLAGLTPRPVHRWILRARRRRAWALLAHPLAVWLAALVVLWTWHVPALYQAAPEHPGVHAVEHLCFLVTSFAFWEVALAPGGRRRLARGIDVLYVFTGGLAAGALGALLAFSASPIYPHYVETASAWGVSALADQQVAGVIMWIPAGMVSLAVAASLFVQWFRAMERQAERAESAMGLPPLASRTMEAGP